MLDSSDDTELSAAQEATLRAAVDRIIPPDDQFPGGVEAGVLDYLLRHLQGSDGFLKAYLPVYKEGLDALEDLAKSTYGTAFSDLSIELQDQTLIVFAERAKSFFLRMVEHTQEGFYTSPTGLELVGWKVTG